MVVHNLAVVWHFVSSLHLLYHRAVIYEFQLYEFCTEYILQSRAAPYHIFQLLMSKVLASVCVCFK